VGAGRQAVVAGLAWVALAIAPASAADMSSLGIDNTIPPPDTVIGPGPDTYTNFFQEVRVGVFSHNEIHDEGAPVDVSAELLSSPIGYANNIGGKWFSWFFNPRINIGAMINTGGKTSYLFTGLTWRVPIYGPFFFEGEFGGSVNNGPEHPEGDRIFMGCVPNFRESGGFGVQLTPNIDVIGSVEHNSHATFCTHIDPGLTDFGVRVGYKF
jgi:lipid A 3-O-deacylase